MGRHFGHIPSVDVGSWFQNRTALRNAGVHLPPMDGIEGGIKEGANSIVVSGGYEDDIDEGEVIIYTGAGGNDKDTKVQIADQPGPMPGIEQFESRIPDGVCNLTRRVGATEGSLRPQNEGGRPHVFPLLERRLRRGLPAVGGRSAP